MSGFEKSKQPGIDIYRMPGLSSETTTGEVFSYFSKEITGKTLSMHYLEGPNGENIVRDSPIRWNGLMENGKVAIMTDDALGKPTMLEFDGNSTHMSWSIYEENDLWFQDGDNERLWWGVYDTPLDPAWISLDSE